MEGAGVGKDCNALGGLFQQIVMDLKNGTPLWEDFMTKATKLHTCLRATIHAIGVYLDAFQKIADAATNARGATKEIGTALTRMCLRHRAVEARMKTFSSAIMDCLVVPLQEKLEDWKKTIVNLDKEHAKEYKKARSELKKRSTDTLRLQKKARKGSKMNELHKALQDVSDRKAVLEETEKRAVREALIEERSRYCIFVTFLKPVLEEEVAMLMELSHLQEVMDKLEMHTAEPYSLPPASEQVLIDYKGSEMSWTHQTPPGSPSSLGSRKSSMCSINSINSWSSSSTHSPTHQYWSHSLLQPASNELRYKGPLPPSRLSNSSSRDSGFTSQDTIYTKRQSYPTAPNSSDSNSSSAGSSTPSTPFASSECGTWPNAQETLQFERAASAIMNDARPHTISGGAHHQRPALNAYTFQPDSSIDKTPVVSPQNDYAHVPDVPSRDMHKYTPTLLKTSEYIQPTYVNMHELANMAANKAQERSAQHNELPSNLNLKNDVDRKESTSESSLESSSGYSSQTAISNATPDEEVENTLLKYCTLDSRNSSVVKERVRPASTLGYSSLRSGTLSRRSSMQNSKPPPPIRRTPSILNNSVQNLPPPPPFLLDTAVDQRQQSRSHTSLASEKVYAEPMTHQRKPSGGSVAETVRNLTQLNHTPASPILLRRTPSNRSTSADRCINRSSEPVAGFMASLSSRLLQQQPKTTSGSPKSSRRWIAPAKQPVLDPATCHDSLMEQVRKGLVLKRTITVNDRSAPKTN